MIRERELPRTAGSVSHTPLCNFFRHSTLISSILIPCIQSHIICRPFVFVRTHCAPASPPTPSRMTSSTPAPTYRTPTATLLRDAKLLALSSPPVAFSTALPARLSQFRVRCIMLPQAAGCSCCQYSFRLYTTSCLFPFISVSSQLQLHGRLPAHWFR